MLRPTEASAVRLSCIPLQMQSLQMCQTAAPNIPAALVYNLQAWMLTIPSAAERPLTPHAPPPPANAAMHEAASLLQRLLRGRATQNQMFAGKQANLALIRVSSVQYDIGCCI